MSLRRQASSILLAAALASLGGLASVQAAAQKKDDTEASQLPAQLRGAKVYQIPEETKFGEQVENPVIYKNLSYQDISFERLLLNLFLSIKPVERAATIHRIYFQDIRVNGIPVHVETFEQEFKLSKKEVVDLPAPLKCSIVFSDLSSLAPVKEIISQDKIRVTGQSFIEVKLNAVEKIALRSKRLVLPVTLNEQVPLEMFSKNPLLQLAASKILETLSDPSSAAAVSLAKEHLAKLTDNRALDSLGRHSLYLLYCEYALRNPKTKAAEKFSQAGTAFLASADGKLLTAKRVIQPWKFDPQVAFLAHQYHLELDPNSYRLFAWSSGARVLSLDGQPEFQTASSTDKQTLKIVKTAPDRMAKQDYQDADTGEKATLNLHAEGENDVAVLQLGGANFQPLAIADLGAKVGPDLKTNLIGFPFGLSQTQANPQSIPVKAAREGSVITVEHQLNPGESGAPLLNPEGKVLALCSGTNECAPIETVRTLIQ